MKQTNYQENMIYENFPQKKPDLFYNQRKTEGQTYFHQKTLSLYIFIDEFYKTNNFNFRYIMQFYEGRTGFLTINIFDQIMICFGMLSRTIQDIHHHP